MNSSLVDVYARNVQKLFAARKAQMCEDKKNKKY